MTVYRHNVIITGNMDWLRSLIYSAGPKLANYFQGQWYELQFLVESFKTNFQAQNITKGRKTKLLEKKDVSKQSKIPGWVMESSNKSQSSKHIIILRWSGEKLWSTGNWFYTGALNYLSFWEIGDFCSDSHKAADTKGHVSSQHHFLSKRHWAIISFNFELYQEFSSWYSSYRNTWLKFHRNFLQALKYGMEPWEGGGRVLLLMWMLCS